MLESLTPSYIGLFTYNMMTGVIKLVKNVRHAEGFRNKDAKDKDHEMIMAKENFWKSPERV